jgi:hypothetical protein
LADTYLADAPLGAAQRDDWLNAIQISRWNKPSFGNVDLISAIGA